MAAISFHCPNCGGDLRFDPTTQKYKCAYCISAFSQEELEAANPQAADPQVAGDFGEGQARMRAPSRQGQGAGGQDAVEYSCPSCGAQIVTDETTAATFCYYCHNPVVLQGKLTGDVRPDSVIPFAIGREEAVERFLADMRKKKLVPKDFFCAEQIEKISGVYFPFWLYSCTADGQWQGTATRVHVFRRGKTEITQTQVYEVGRSGDLVFRDIANGALQKMNRELVEAVQPFRLAEAKEFSMGYLSGFQAEKRDIGQEQMSADVRREVDAHARQMMRASVTGYATVQETAQDVRIRKETWRYLLLPVWVLTYKGSDGALYYYAMNGQTGKVAGVLPVDKKRMACLFLGIFLPLFAILLAGGYFLW